MTSIALHLGLNAVDGTRYDGWTGDLAGCENDARDLAALTRAEGFDAEVVLTRDATRARVLAFLARGQALRAGDRMIVTFSGHGTQVPVTSDAGELDGLDEAWVLHDRLLLDNELRAALERIPAGVRVCVVLDCCHSGTAIRLFRARGGKAARLRFMPLEVARAVFDAEPAASRQRSSRALADRRAGSAAVVLLAACQDHQVALDGDDNGAFTGALKRVWDRGRFRGDHREFRARIERELPRDQTPAIDTLGPDADLTSFLGERPFRAGLVGASAAPSTENDMTAFTTNHGNWDEVSAELERRFPSTRDQDSPSARLIEANARAAAEAFFGPNATVPVPLAVGSARGAARGGTVARAFWWGFHIEISHQDLQVFLSAADPINAMIGALGGGIPSPAAPFIALAAAFVAGALGLLRGLDKGRGVYISMTWFFPGVFIPTTV